MSDHPSITCPCCGATSHHPGDIREGYCGACHWWTSDRGLGVWLGRGYGLATTHDRETCPARRRAAAINALRVQALRAIAQVYRTLRIRWAADGYDRWADNLEEAGP